jgi:hypothetical protein
MGSLRIKILFQLASVLFVRANAQSILFDFDNAPPHTSLPISLTAGSVTAQFSANGQGFSIQPANTLGFTPSGFAGYCIYPNSVFAADLRVIFSAPLSDFSILYAPEEYACDSSATMRVTAYLDGALVGKATTNAQAGTWPTETLHFNSAQPFNSVVVHYDKAPATGGDWGPIFMADNMLVTPAPQPIVLTGVALPAGGGFQLNFAAVSAASFSVLATTNLMLPPSNWPVLGTATEVSPGQYQFTDFAATNAARQFYRVQSP